jgi:hypothetical protein
MYNEFVRVGGGREDSCACGVGAGGLGFCAIVRGLPVERIGGVGDALCSELCFGSNFASTWVGEVSDVRVAGCVGVILCVAIIVELAGAEAEGGIKDLPLGADMEETLT